MQLQCGIGCAKNHKNNKTLPHGGFGREGDLALSSCRQVEFFSGSQLICFLPMGLVLIF